MKLVLASTSKYRLAQLKNAGITAIATDPLFDEEKYKKDFSDPKEMTLFLAREKALSLKPLFSNDFIIGADQTALFEGEVIGKPGTTEKAVQQLMKFQGKTHDLITSVVAVLPTGEILEHTEVIKLTMRELTENRALKYVKCDHPIWCAGSYKLESAGISLFTKIDGEDQSAIQGMPMLWLSDQLNQFNLLPF